MCHDNPRIHLRFYYTNFLVSTEDTEVALLFSAEQFFNAAKPLLSILTFLAASLKLGIFENTEVLEPPPCPRGPHDP